jgi:hypothetical protein
MKTSKFLKRADVGEDGMVVTIVNVHEANVAKEGDPEENKWVMVFREVDKPMVLNSTNAQLCEKYLGSDNTDDWAGKKVLVYDDPSVQYAGKMVGGLRIKRAPGGIPSGAGAKGAKAAVSEDDQVPF